MLFSPTCCHMATMATARQRHGLAYEPLHRLHSDEAQKVIQDAQRGMIEGKEDERSRGGGNRQGQAKEQAKDRDFAKPQHPHRRQGQAEDEGPWDRPCCECKRSPDAVDEPRVGEDPRVLAEADERGQSAEWVRCIGADAEGAGQRQKDKLQKAPGTEKDTPRLPGAKMPREPDEARRSWRAGDPRGASPPILPAAWCAEARRSMPSGA